MARRALLVIDMTTEQMANISYRRDALVATVRNLVLNGGFDAKVDSHLWFSQDGPPSSLADMYPDIRRVGTAGAQLIPELQGLELDFVEKYQYSCFAGGSKLEDYLKESCIDEVVLVGINTDYCIFATALDSFANRFRTRVIQDGVSSLGGRQGHLHGVQMIEQFVGDVFVDASEFLEQSVLKKPSKKG